MFIHIGPEETETIRRIPRALLFPAPGLPKGHMVMGYSDKGHCPMLADDRCSIYEHRPQTCRTYDCRIFAATGVAADGANQAEIADRAEGWVFSYGSEQGLEEHRTLREAAAFLKKNSDLFPRGSLPRNPAQLAALAVRIYRVFLEMAPETKDGAVAQAIMAAVERTQRQIVQIPRIARNRIGEAR